MIPKVNPNGVRSGSPELSKKHTESICFPCLFAHLASPKGDNSGITFGAIPGSSFPAKAPPSIHFAMLHLLALLQNEGFLEHFLKESLRKPLRILSVIKGKPLEMALYSLCFRLPLSQTSRREIYRKSSREEVYLNQFSGFPENRIAPDTK